MTPPPRPTPSRLQRGHQPPAAVEILLFCAGASALQRMQRMRPQRGPVRSFIPARPFQALADPSTALARKRADYSQTARCPCRVPTRRSVWLELQRFLPMKVFDGRSWSLRLQASITVSHGGPRPHAVTWRGHVLPRPFAAFAFSVVLFLSLSQAVPRCQSSNLFHLFSPEMPQTSAFLLNPK